MYKNSRHEDYVGFIAEDVADLVASNDRRSLSPMEMALAELQRQQWVEIQVSLSN